MQYGAVRHKDGTSRGRYISQAVRKGATLGDKVLGHVADGVLLPYYLSCTGRKQQWFAIGQA